MLLFSHYGIVKDIGHLQAKTNHKNAVYRKSVVVFLIFRMLVFLKRHVYES